MTSNENSQFWRDVSNYSLIIFSIGPWELIRERCGPEQGWQTRIDAFLNSLFEREEELTTNTTFIWRKWGNIDFDIERKAKMSWKKAYMYNEYVKQKMDEHDHVLKSQARQTSQCHKLH